MALIGIIFALITNWQASTLSISTRTNAMSQRLSDLNDVTGYVGDRVRSALRVRAAISGLSVNSKVCSADFPCLAVALPKVDASSGQTTGYTTYVYRIEERSGVSSEDKVSDAWAETNTRVLREYRSPASISTDCTDITSASCAAVLGNLSTTSSFSSFQPYLVADYLTPADGLGSGVAPFVYDATTKAVTFAFQSKQQVRGQTQLIPSTPYTLTVQARNVP